MEGGGGYIHTLLFFTTQRMPFSRGIGGRTGGQPINQKLKFLRQIFFGPVDPVL